VTCAFEIQVIDDGKHIDWGNFLIAIHIVKRLAWISDRRERSWLARVDVIDEDQGIERRNRAIAIDIDRVDWIPPIDGHEPTILEGFNHKSPKMRSLALSLLEW